MVDPTRVKKTSKGIVSRSKKIQSDLGINDRDCQTIVSDDGKIIPRKAKIEIDHKNPDDAWKEHAKRRLAHD